MVLEVFIHFVGFFVFLNKVDKTPLHQVVLIFPHRMCNQVGKQDFLGKMLCPLHLSPYPKSPQGFWRFFTTQFLQFSMLGQYISLLFEIYVY